MGDPLIRFHLSSRSGVPAYAQIVQQVRHALRLGVLTVGDQLPTVKEAVGMVAVNPNTVLKAYRELEYEGLVAARPGRGTFVTRTLEDEAAVASQSDLRRRLDDWVAAARSAGVDDETLEAMALAALRAPAGGSR